MIANETTMYVELVEAFAWPLAPKPATSASPILERPHQSALPTIDASDERYVCAGGYARASRSRSPLGVKVNLWSKRPDPRRTAKRTGSSYAGHGAPVSGSEPFHR